MIEQTRDFRRIKRLVDANIRNGEDTIDVSISIANLYFLEVEDGKDIGAWGFTPLQDGYRIHAAMSPACRGKKAARSALDAMWHVFQETDAAAIYVATGRQDIGHLARYVGMERCGVHSGEKLYKMKRVQFRKAA